MDIKPPNGAKRTKKNKKSELANSVLIDYNFLAKISHQMRTPITVIKESVSLLLDEIPGDINPKQKRILNICKSNTERLVNEMNNILRQLYAKSKIYEKMEGLENGQEKDIAC